MSSQRLNLRAQLIALLVAVQNGQSLAQIQPQYLSRVALQDKPLFHELSLGVLRQWFALKQVTLPLLDKPLNDAAIASALYLGIYQILCTRIADHAAISETVSAVKQLGYESASGLVNAILRRVTREQAHFAEQLAQAHGLPSWLYKRLKKDWPEQLTMLSQQLKHSAPLCLRVNQRQIGRDAYLLKLAQQNIAAQPSQLSTAGIVLQQNVVVSDLPGYVQGWFSVQDEHAQLAASLLPDLNGKRVLDACAAPGGKSAHILEQFQPEVLLALDCDSTRLLRVEENLQRLQLNTGNVDVVAADARTWQSSKPFDFILLDAPCSATGVIRRHPDIRLLRQSTDIASTVDLQHQILQQMWQQLKVGGQLLYITCSILKDENERQMQQFIAQHTDAQAQELSVNWGLEQQYGRQLLPTAGQGDGFYYCLINKVA